MVQVEENSADGYSKNHVGNIDYMDSKISNDVTSQRGRSTDRHNDLVDI